MEGIVEYLILVKAFLPRIRDRTVKFLTDCQPAMTVCKTGSMNPGLQELAKGVFELCFENNIRLEVGWIPRSQNEKADAISRMADDVDIDDWQISQEFFKILDGKWGPITIDLMANFYNNKCERFYSLFYSPRSLGVDALSFSWKGEVALLVPPISLIPKALSHARLCRAEVILVVPHWTSASFWPLICGEFLEFLEDILIVNG